MNHAEQREAQHLDTEHSSSEYSTGRSAPVEPVGPGCVRCTFCTSTTFSRSRFRFSDLFRFLTLQYPVRCTNCVQRQYVTFAVASISAYARKPKNHKQGRDSWKKWTNAGREDSHPTESVHEEE